MARLTGFSRFLIVLLIVGGLFFLAKKFLSQPTGGSSEASKTEMPSGSNSGGETSTAPAPAQNDGGWNGGGSTASTEPGRPFAFSPTEPVNGKLRGVVELGATGFNSFIIKMDAQKNWKVEKKEFNASLVYENMATEEDIRSGLKNYIAKMVAFGVPGKDIHFVVSSGAKKVPATQQISNALRTMNYFVNEVTPEQEGRLALKAAMARGFEGKAFVVDIGSGNTKISYSNGGTISAYECAGAKYFQNNLSDESVYQDVVSKSNNIPSHLRGTCFIIGGVPFELANQHRNGQERYTVLKGAGSYKADGAKQKCGLNIYKAVADATGCKQFVFDWDANFTIGFLLGL